MGFNGGARSLRKSNPLDSGFTLIELLVVIIIIGILASIAVIGVSTARKTANDSQCLANATQTIKALTEYELATGSSLSLSATISNKALTSNVATLTTSSAHGFAVGNSVTVTGVDSVFNGTYPITAVTTTTFSYTKTNVNVTSVAATGSALVPSTATGALTYQYATLSILWGSGAGAGVTYIARPIDNFDTATAGRPYYLQATRTVTGAYSVQGYTDSTLTTQIASCLAVSG